MKSLLAQKIGMTRSFDAKGQVVPITEVKLDTSVVTTVKTLAKDGYRAYQVGFGNKVKSKLHLFLREFRIIKDEDEPKIGDAIQADHLFQPGDLVSVTAISKGKGFASVIKKYGFKGGPRTHGQSDRERAPGSVGQTTTPGRVYKGKRMAGRMGGKQITVRNLQVFKIDMTNNVMSLTGAIPGRKNTLLKITKV